MSEKQSPDAGVDERDFDKMAARFTAAIQLASSWKHNFYGAAYSTRIKAAIEFLKEEIATAERHPEIAPATSPPSREDTIEECARVADEVARDYGRFTGEETHAERQIDYDMERAAMRVAREIRALHKGEW